MKNYSPRLFVKYNTEIKKELQKKLNINNFMRLPRLKKIVLNMGLGNARDDKNTFKQALEELTIITGQKAIGTKSKRAISNFKIREGDLVGASVTLRKKNMYEFLDRFISIAAPRIRDFRGLESKGFDGRGNYNFGITEQIIFPEINYDKVNSIRGMNVTIVTSAYNDYEAYELLTSFGFPINEYKKKQKISNAKNKIKENLKLDNNKSEEVVSEGEVKAESEEVVSEEEVKAESEEVVSEEEVKAESEEVVTEGEVKAESDEVVSEEEIKTESKENSSTDKNVESEEKEN